MVQIKVPEEASNPGMLMPRSQMRLLLPNGSFAQPTVLTNRIMQFVSDPAYSAPTPHLVPESDMSGESSRSSMVPIQPGDD